MNTYIGSMSGYSEGWAAGKEATLLKVQSELHEAAMDSADGRIGPEEIDKIIYTLLEN
jgi:hypothetical protein